MGSGGERVQSAILKKWVNPIGSTSILPDKWVNPIGSTSILLISGSIL